MTVIPEKPEMKRFLVSPAGFPVRSVITHSWVSSAYVDEVDEHGFVSDFSHAEFPEMELCVNDAGHFHVVDSFDNEWSGHHCRTMMLPEDTDVHMGPAVAEAWPDEVQAWCRRVDVLNWMLTPLTTGWRRAPQDIRNDMTLATVMQNVVIARIEDEVKGLEQKISAWRAQAEACSA